MMSDRSLHEPLLEVRDLEFSYPDSLWSLRIPAFMMRPGELVAFIGPNGSGKSTFTRLLSGTTHPQKGDIRLQGQSLSRMERRQIAQRMGYLPQDPQSGNDYRVMELAAMGRYPHTSFGGFLQEEDCRIIDESMRLTGIEPFANRRLSHLSGGERRRAFLASVLAQEPDILLLDEPTSALDIHHQSRLFSIIQSLTGRGIAVLVVTHDINLASQFCNRIVFLYDGSILAEGTPSEVLTEQRLQQVYGHEVILAQHPQTQSPVVFIQRQEP